MPVDDQESRKDGHDYVSLTSSILCFFPRYPCTGVKVCKHVQGTSLIALLTQARTQPFGVLITR